MNETLEPNRKPKAQAGRQRLTEFKRKHGIRTHQAKHLLCEDEPWIALIPFSNEKNKSIEKMIADSGRLYDEAGFCAYGAGELTAIRKLCAQCNIPCSL